jgi:hypothetical protein
MALRSPSASDVILFPAKVTLTIAGKVESSPDGTFVKLLLLKSIESTNAATAAEMPELMKLLIWSSFLFAPTHFSDRWELLRDDNPHVHGSIDAAGGQ